MTDNKWMPLEEAIKHVMKVEKCSRKVARKKIAEATKANKLKTRAVPVEPPPMTLMSGPEAADRFMTDPASVYISLYDFITHSEFTGKELMGELQSGRLRAHGNSEATMFRLQMGEMPHPSEFSVDGQSLVNWMTNPKTPPHLKEKFNNGLNRKPS